MVKKVMSESDNLFSFENIIGLLLAILIIFDLKVEEPICRLINTNMGLVSSIVVVLLLAVFVHPIVAILFVIYLYQCSNKTGSYSQESTNNTLQQLNPPNTLQVEEEVIYNVAPIKNQNKDSNLAVTPYSVNVGSAL
jgi:hypothetical protein